MVVGRINRIHIATSGSGKPVSTRQIRIGRINLFARIVTRNCNSRRRKFFVSDGSGTFSRRESDSLHFSFQLQGPSSSAEGEEVGEASQHPRSRGLVFVADDDAVQTELVVAVPEFRKRRSHELDDDDDDDRKRDEGQNVEVARPPEEESRVVAVLAQLPESSQIVRTFWPAVPSIRTLNVPVPIRRVRIVKSGSWSFAREPKSEISRKSGWSLQVSTLLAVAFGRVWAERNECALQVSAQKQGKSNLFRSFIRNRNVIEDETEIFKFVDKSKIKNSIVVYRNRNVWNTNVWKTYKQSLLSSLYNLKHK